MRAISDIITIVNPQEFSYLPGDEIEVYTEKEILNKDSNLPYYNRYYAEFLKRWNYQFILWEKIDGGWKVGLFTSKGDIKIDDYQIKRLISRGKFKGK